MEILYTGGVAMTHASIQFFLDDNLTDHDTQFLKERVLKVSGIRYIELQVNKGLLCIDYDEAVQTQAQLVKRLADFGYVPFFLDKIIF